MAKAVKRTVAGRKRVRMSIHRQYTIEEAARVANCCRATIKRMIERGLPVIADRRPILILGEDLANFRNTRRRRQPCGLAELFCFKCRKPCKPALGMADFVAKPSKGANLVALCETCATVMNKRVARARLSALMSILDITVQQAEPHLSDSPQPSLNDPFHKD